MYAVIVSGGKQYRVEVGDVVYLEKLDAEAEQTIVFDEVLILDGKIGTPAIKGARVEGKVVKHGKGKKIIVFRYRPKKGSKRKLGHRQPYTKVEITKISG
jgi:ribosomal protein L21